jgi:hypothetical protein
MKPFFFHITHPVGNVLKTYEEEGEYHSQDFAYMRFRELLKKYPPEGYYYLCRWGEGTLEQFRNEPATDDWGGI